MFVTQTLAFGTLLRQLRKRAGMTQRDLATALGYSDSLISGLEKAQRQPDRRWCAPTLSRRWGCRMIQGRQPTCSNAPQSLVGNDHL